MWLLAGTAWAERLPLRAFTTGDGLASNRVAAIVRDSQGFLWFCTGNGLSRFDGRTFRTFGIPEGLSSRYVNHLVEERPGRYWVATNGGGLFRFVPRPAGASPSEPRFSRVPVGSSTATNRVNGLAIDRRRRLWMGTDDGLYVMESMDRPDVVRRIHADHEMLGQPLLQIWSLFEDLHGVLWAGTSSGLAALLPDGRAVHRTIRAIQGADHVWAIAPAADGVLIGHDSGLALARMNHDAEGALEIALVRGPKTPAGAEDPVRGLLRSSDGRLWIGGNAGVGVLDGETLRSLLSVHDLDGAAGAISEDAGGNIWVVRTAGGAIRISRTAYVEYDTRDGLTDPPFGRIFQARSGELCVVGRRHISTFDGESFHPIRPLLPAEVRGVGRGSYGAAFEDHLGEWWIPAGDRLYRFPPVARVDELATRSPTAAYTVEEGLSGGDISRMFEDSRGDLWMNVRIPVGAVITRWDRTSGVFHRYGEPEGLRPFNAASAFAEDRTGTVWIGFWDGGLARYRQGRFEWVPEFDVIGGSGGPLHVDRDGRLWVGTLQDVKRIDVPSAERVVDLRPLIVPGLEHVRVWSFVEDDRGRLYLGTGDGIVRVEENRRPVRIPIPADIRLESAAAFRDRAGLLWFASTRGAIRLRRGDDTDAAASVRIDAVRSNGRPHLLDEMGQDAVPMLAFGANERRVEISYFALGAGAGTDDLAFQYRLQGGSSQDWSAPSRSTTVEFAHLAAGNYHFDVRPIGADGSVIGPPATVGFEIPPPIWERWWFLSLVALAAASGAVSLHRHQVRRAVEVERLRTSIASDLHDDIGANLSQISLLSEMLRGRGGRANPEAAATLASIAELSRESVDAMSDIVWAIDPRKDRLASLVPRMRRLASDLLAAGNIEFTLIVDGRDKDTALPADVRRHVYLVFKEALNNIMRHSGAGTVDIRLGIEDDCLVLVIHDDGHGFDVTAASDGHGLTSLRQRARRLGGRLDVTSAPDRGTTVALRVPKYRPHMDR